MVIRTMRKPLGARDSQIRSVALHKCTATPFEMKRSYVYWRIINDTRSRAIVLGQTVFNFAACDWERSDTSVSGQYSYYQKHLYPTMAYTVTDGVPDYEEKFSNGTAVFTETLSTMKTIGSNNTYVTANWEYLPLVWHPCGGFGGASFWLGAIMFATGTATSNVIKINTYVQTSNSATAALSEKSTAAGSTTAKWIGNAKSMGSYHACIGTSTQAYFIFTAYCGTDANNATTKYGYQKISSATVSATCYQGAAGSTYQINAYDVARQYESHLVPRMKATNSTSTADQNTWFTFSANTTNGEVYRYRNNSTPTNDTSLSFDLSTEADYATVGNPIRYWVLDNWEHPCETGCYVFHMRELTPWVLYYWVIDGSNNVVNKASVKAVEYAKIALGNELKYFTAIYNYGNIIYVGTNTGLLVFDCHTMVTNDNTQAQNTWVFYRYTDYGEIYPLKPVGIIDNYLYFIRMNDPRIYTVDKNYTLTEDATTHLWRVNINNIKPNKVFTEGGDAYNPTLFVGYNTYTQA